MFALVRFVSDNVFYVCKSDDIKLSKLIKCRVKWIDGYYYSAITICKHDCEEVLQDIQNNLEQNFPIVVLKRHEISEHNFCVEAIEYKNVYACIEQNTSTPHQFDQSSTINNFQDNLTRDIPNCNSNVLSISPAAHTSTNGQFNVDTASPDIDVDAVTNIELVQEVATSKFVNMILNDPDSQEMDYFGTQLESPGLRDSIYITDNDISSSANPNQIECTEILDCSELLSPEGIVNASSLPQVDRMIESDCQFINESDNEVPLLSESSSKERKNVYTPFTYNRDVVITPSYTDHERSDVYKKTVSGCEEKGRRRHFCIYCKNLYAKLSQHLERSHREETAVRMFLSLPTKNIERRKIIETIRRRGDFDYNTSSQNESGELLVARRSHSGFMRESKHYLPCPHCAAFFCKDTLRLHTRTCLPPTKKVKDGKTLKQISRGLLSNVHPMANEMLKTKIFPVMRDDEFVNVVRYDQLAISFGNFMCSKYVSQHHHDMIRSRLRFIGRLLITAKTLDQTVKDFANLLTPSKFDVVVESIKRIGGINEDSTSYRAPTTVLHLSTICKQACRIWKSECIKNCDANGKQNVDDFLSLFNATFPAALGRTAFENRVEHQRQKIVELPTSADIKKLVAYLREQRRKWLSIVKDSKVTNLEYAVKQLASFTLVSLMVFNRRRPGELERITLKDFKSLRSAQSISTATGHAYNEEEAELLKRYKRFEIRGKLNRTVPVLVDYEMESCINLIITKREEIGVKTENPYVFAYPSKDHRHKYFRAGNLLRDYASLCGATKPLLLRATHLRKQIATECALDDMAENVIHDVANFMGHAIDIHNNIYRMPVDKRDIVRISKILEKVQGNTENNLDEIMDEEGQTPIVALTSSVFSLISSNMQDGQQVGTVEYENSRTGQEASPVRQSSVLTSNDSDSSEVQISKSPKKSRTKGFFRVCGLKKPWKTNEKQAALLHFKKFLTKNKLPSIATLCEKLPYIEELKNRSPTSVKSWLQNELVKKQENLEPLPSTSHNIKRTRWTPAMKRILNTVFADHLDSGTLPSLPECLQAMENYKELQGFSAAALKTAVANKHRRRLREISKPCHQRILFRN